MGGHTTYPEFGPAEQQPEPADVYREETWLQPDYDVDREFDDAFCLLNPPKRYSDDDLDAWIICRRDGFVVDSDIVDDPDELTDDERARVIR